MSVKKIGKIFAHDRSVGGGEIFGICRLIQFLCKATEHLNAFRLGGKASEELAQNRAQLAVTAVRHQIVDGLSKGILLQLCKRRAFCVVLRVAVIVLLKQTVHDFGSNGEHLGIVRHTEGSRKGKTLEVCTHCLLKESINGRDLRAAQKEELTRKMRIFGVLCHCIGQCLCNSALKLCGGGTRTGNNEHAGEIGRVFGIGQLANNSFGEYTCFTRSCGGRYKQGFAVKRHCGLLRGGPGSTH